MGERKMGEPSGHLERPGVGFQESISRIELPNAAEHRALPWEQVNHLLNQIESLLRADREMTRPRRVQFKPASKVLCQIVDASECSIQILWQSTPGGILQRP